MNYLPDRKVLAGGIAGLATWVITRVAKHYGYDLPPDTQAMLTFLVTSAVAYLVPPSDQDIVKRLNDDLVQMAKDDPNVPVSK